jgi:hypothetical protein
MKTCSRRRLGAAVTALGGAVLAACGGPGAPSATLFEGTAVGGLSGLADDARGGGFYAVSDDRGEQQAPRVYTLQIDLSGGELREVRVTGVTTLDADGGAPGVQPYARNAADLEDVVLLPDEDLVISSERDRADAPWLRAFAADETLRGDLPVPEKFLPGPQRGVRPNHGFEGMTATPDGATLYVVNEDALAQDGPLATPDAGAQLRLLRYDRRGADWIPGPEYVYAAQRMQFVLLEIAYRDLPATGTGPPPGGHVGDSAGPSVRG